MGRHYDASADEWVDNSWRRGELALRSRFRPRIGQFGMGVAWHIEGFSAIGLTVRLRWGQNTSLWANAHVGRLCLSASAWRMR